MRRTAIGERLSDDANITNFIDTSAFRSNNTIIIREENEKKSGAKNKNPTVIIFAPRVRPRENQIDEKKKKGPNGSADMPKEDEGEDARY